MNSATIQTIELNTYRAIHAAICTNLNIHYDMPATAAVNPWPFREAFCELVKTIDEFAYENMDYADTTG